MKTVNRRMCLLWQKFLHVQSFGLLTLPGHLNPVKERMTHKSSVLLLLNHLSGAFVLFRYYMKEQNVPAFNDNVQRYFSSDLILESSKLQLWC